MMQSTLRYKKIDHKTGKIVHCESSNSLHLTLFLKDAHHVLSNQSDEWAVTSSTNRW